MYPKTNFINMEYEEEQDPQQSSTQSRSCNTLESVLDPPLANSTVHESQNKTMLSNSGSQFLNSLSNKKGSSLPTSKCLQTSCRGTDCPNCFNNLNVNQDSECLSNEVGHASHIPRCPPKPSTYTIPSIINKSREVLLPNIIAEEDEELFGVIKLKQNDVCYTNGIIEWVGRKRNYPINSGFKILKVSEPSQKRLKTQDNSTAKSCKLGLENPIECDCVNVLPTVNAIVDHLNALHEAVDIVDLRLNNLECVSNIN